MVDQNDGIAVGDQIVHHTGQAHDIRRVQADGRLVKHIEDAGRSVAHCAGQLHPLALTGRERRRRAVHRHERYFIDDKSIHVERKNPYYSYCNEESTCRKILEEFGLNPNISHIINRHVPVKTLKGESPVKANGRLYIIDGGFSKAYQKETGIAGYTLIYNSYGLKIVAHEPFESVEKAVKEGRDIISSTR